MSDPIAVSLTPTVQAPVSLEVVEAPIQQIHVDLHQGTPGLSAYELAVSNGFAGTLAEWLASLSILAGAVASVNGRSGAVVLTKVDVGLSRVSNTSDTEKLALLGSAIDTVAAEYSADPARVIQDTTHRFVSDAEKSAWNGKEDAGTATAAVAAHVSAADPHGDRANAATLYQPLSVGKGLSTNDYTTDEKSKLAGIAAGATANSSDATLRARANHTGTQLAATISDFAVTARGEVTSGIADHAAAADPHGDRADAASKYQPLSAGKGLSANDYTTAEKTKLAGIAAGATANTASTANPLQAGTAAPGTAAPYAREDHVHPTDTSRAAATAMTAADDALWRAASARVGIDGIYFDGATTGRGLTMSAPAALAGKAHWVAWTMDVPTSNLAVQAGICSFNDSTSNVYRAYGELFTHLTNGNLAFYAFGSTTGDCRLCYLAGFRAAWAGLRIVCFATFSPGTTAPQLWINRVAQTLSETSGGTPPNWCSDSLVTTVNRFFADWNASTATLIGYGLGTLTQADVDMYHVSGMLPFWARAAASTTALTSGTLVRGQQYLISSYVAGDSFTNVGAASNATGVSFTATGTTPTTWSNASQLIALGALAIPLYQKSIYTSDETGNGNYGTIVGGTAKVRFDLSTANLRDWTPYAAAGTVLGVTDTAYTMLQKLDARIDEAAYQLQAGAAELAIPLSYTGTGAGVLTMKLFSDIAQTVTIDGAGKFYTDAAGTLNEATSYAMAANAWTTFYIKVPSSTCTMRVPSGRAIRYFGSPTNPFIGETANGPKVNNLATSKIRQGVLAAYVLSFQGLSVITGTTYPWLNAMYVLFYGNSLTVSGTTYPWLNAMYVFFYGHSLTVSGTTYPWINATQVYFVGNSLTVSGQTYPWLNATLVVFNGASLTVSGATYPWINATQVYFNGNSLTITANLSTSVLYSGANNFDLYINGTGISASYPTTRAWPRNISRVYVRPATGSMVSADVDRILIDIASTANLAAVGYKAIDLGGNCGAHTSASNAAIATLTGLGFAVTVN